MSPILPIDNPILPFWRTELDELDSLRTTPDLPQETDIAIIGAGYAGVTLAYYLLKQLGHDAGTTSPSSHPTITLLDARQICSGATGRNGGHLRPDIYGHIPTYIERYGLDAGVEIADFEYAHMQALKDLLAEEQIDCDFNITRNMNVYLSEDGGERARLVYEKLLAQGVAVAKDLHYTSAKNAEGISGVKGAKACLSYTSGTLWPYKFILGLLHKIASSPALNVQAQTPVTAVTTTATEDGTAQHTIHTARGVIRARKVVYATNAYTGGLLPQYAKNIVPCRGICSHIAVPEGSSVPFLPYSYVVYTKEGGGGSYLISRPDGSIIVGGAQYTFKDAREQWYNVVDDGTLIEPTEHYYDDYMQRTFRGWEGSGAYVKEIWTGIMGYSYDSHPHIGQVPEKPDQYICAGFNGHGMPVVLLSAKCLAEMIATGKPFEETETRLPRLFKTTAERIHKAQTGPEGGDILGK